MKSRTILTAAALLGLAVLVGAAASEPSRAQDGYSDRWESAGVYPTAEGGEIWIYNVRSGVVKNCYWRASSPGSNATLRCSQMS